MKLEKPFDTEYLNALFQIGYELGKAGDRWANVLPGHGGVNPLSTVG